MVIINLYYKKLVGIPSGDKSRGSNILEFDCIRRWYVYLLIDKQTSIEDVFDQFDSLPDCWLMVYWIVWLKHSFITILQTFWIISHNVFLNFNKISGWKELLNLLFIKLTQNYILWTPGESQLTSELHANLLQKRTHLNSMSDSSSWGDDHHCTR